jgi:hypothetical protein
MRKSLLTVLVVFGVGLLAAQAGAYVTGFDAGYTPGALVGQPGASSPQWDYSAYSSNPAGAGDSWLSSANVVADPTNASNQVAQFYGDCSGGATHGASASVVIPASATGNITFTQSGYFDSAHVGTQSLCISTLANGGCQWGGSQNLTFGNYGYFVKRYDQATADALAAGNVAWSLWDDSAGNYDSIFVPMNTWATASVTFHMATGTADLVVTDAAGTQQILGIATSYISGGVIGGQTRYDAYTDGDGGVVGNIYLDNVVVTPEPMTLTLLALGGLAIIRRRHA